FVTSKEIYRSAKTSDTISGLQNGKYILKVEALNEFGCNSVKLDTFAYLNQSYIHIKGDSIVCPENEIPYSILSNLSNNFKGHLKWYVDNQLSSSSDLPVFKFQNSSVLEARINLVKGKWNCTLKDKLQIHVQKNTVITGPDEIKVCYNSGLFDLNKVLVSPANGKWTSSSEKLVKSFVNTDDVYPYQQDTLPILYTLDDVCSSKKSIQFILQALPDIELSNATICDTNSAIYLRQMVRKPYNTNDFSYSWKLNDPSARMEEVNGRTVVYPVDLGIGSHLLFVECTGQNGCSAKDTGQINILPSVKIDLKPEVVCQNNGLVDLQKRFKVSPSGGSWSFFDFDLFDVHNRLKTDTCGTFSIKYIYDQFGCYDEKELSLVIQCQPDITTTMRKEVCFDELPLQLVGTPSGGNWQGAYINGDLFSPPVSGKQESYKLYYLLDEGSCRFVQNFDLRINPLPTIQLFTNKLVYCQGEDILVNGRVDNTNLLEFKYNSKVITEQIFNSQTFSNHYLSTAGKNQQVKLNQIFLKGTNTYGCSKNEILYFNLLPGPEIKTIEDIELCENVKLSVDPEILYSGSGNLSYQWFLNQNPFSTNKNLKELLAPGIYHFDLQVDDGNCSDKTAVKVTVKKAPVASFFVKPAETTSVFKPDFKFVNTSEGAQSYEWYLGNPKGVIHSRSKDVEYTYTDTGSYEIKLIAYNDEGCSSEFTKIVFVKPDILLFIPNAFSPDGKNEEKNNEFGVSINEYGSFQMEVFDRWGQKVFRTNDPDVKWDGTSNSVPCTPDIYFYSIEVYSITGRRYFYRGTITLIR
ncbi:MAG: gliding motility-associated C-terminal domain-containing protein, partial [Flavobacteriales bacterium]|nr:gliding motility-associated C-terminal domain-containing protein [Flavobacteriales bacterium]